MFRLLSLLIISTSLVIVKSEECKSLVDIVFLVDTSDSFGPVNFKIAKELMKTVLSGFTIGKHYARIGVDTFDDTFKSEVKLKTYTKKSSIISAINLIKYRGRGTDTVTALEKVRTISFSTGAGSRIDATKIGIVITDGWSYNTKASVKAASQLKKQGVFLYTIGIGDKILQAEIKGIATDPKRKFSFKAKTRSEAIKLAKDLMKYICKVSHGPFPKGYAGCFKKQKTYTHTTSSHRMTPLICINICKLKAYKYANIEEGSICHCEHALQTDLRLQNSECKTRCHGNKNIFCGGTARVSVYITGYLGCFKDSKDNRMFPKFYFKDVRKMTPELCMSVCKDNSYRYAAVQSHYHCFCGDNLSLGSKKPESECDLKCAGDGTRKCGGGWRNSVFQTNTNFIGCFEERNNKILVKISFNHARMTNDMCIAWCREQGYEFARTTQGNMCGCGNEFHENHETKKDRSECNQKCSGNKNYNCGASSRVSIFNTEIQF